MTSLVCLLIDLRQSLDRLSADLRLLLRKLTCLPNPGPVGITITSENGTMLTFDVNLPELPPEPNDIASGELTVTIAGGEPQVVATTKDQTTVSGFSGDDGSQVDLSFAYIDDAGNRSTTPSTLSVPLTDTIPPADPGALALVVTGEN